MTITCRACGRISKSDDFCEFCNMPLGLQSHFAPKEVLPRLQSPRPIVEEEIDDIPVVLPAPPRPVPSPQPPLLKPVQPAKTNAKLWLLAIGGVFALLVATVVLAEGVLRLRGGSLLGGSGRADQVTKAVGKPALDNQLEWLKEQSYSTPTLHKMLDLAQKPGPNALVIDLGCADGRLAVLAAEQWGAFVLAWDNNPGLVKKADHRAWEKACAHLVRAQLTGEVLDVDLSKADIIFLVRPERFGTVDEVAQKLESKLFKLKPGVRIVSTKDVARPHPALKSEVVHDDDFGNVTLYLYETPLR
jgi:hypothetical protein